MILNQDKDWAHDNPFSRTRGGDPEDGITLKGENPKYDDMHFEANQVIVLGKVII